MKTMTTSCDRTRLKDRILANVAKAIKCIQEFQILKGEENLVLTNSDWQCHKLCEHLDHAFLHGLRHVTHGYWKVVTDFTRKGAVQEIVRLSHVTTDLGRGRAWLYIALNENLLESYMRCFMENSRYVKKYYVKEALVLDQQRLNVLVTLTSGLDFGTFKLEYDMPYLDLSSYQARPKADQSSATHIDDKVSLCSMESSSSLLSSSMSSSMMSSSDYMFPRGYHEEDFGRRRTYSASTDSGFQIEAGSTLLSSRHLSVPCDSSIRSSSPHSDTFTRISRIESIVNVSDQEDSENLEVIRVKSKGDHSKKKKKKLKKLAKKDKNSISEKDEGEVTDSNSLSRDDSTEDTSRATPSDDGNSDIVYNHSTSIGTGLHSPTPLGKISKDDSGYGLCDEAVSMEDETDCGIYNYGKDHVTNDELKAKLSSESALQHTIQSHGDIPKPNLSEKISSHSDHTSHVSPTKRTEAQTTEDKLSSPVPNGPGRIFSTSQQLQVKSVESPSQAVNSSHTDKQGLTETTAAGDHIDVSPVVNLVNSEAVKEAPVISSDIYGSSMMKGQGSTQKPRSNTADELSSKVLEKLAKSETERELEESQQSSVIESGKEQEGKPAEEYESDCSVKVDNNTMLHLMLDVFEKEEEQFIKLFSTRSGHTEGETTVIALLVTDTALYLLSRACSGTLKKDASIPYQELDYISLSIGDQVIQIVCTNRRKQFWVTTGDSALTKCILQSVSDAMESSTKKLPKLSVLTDATTQRIAMTKYAAAETHTQRENVKILSYVLVHWEDPSSSRTQHSARKEGHLLYRSKGLNSIWKTAYMVLRDGVFCLFNSKSDSKPQHFIKLNSENCSGCRRLAPADRNHCLEIMGIQGSSIQLAAANEQEASSWLQVLCQAVSEGQQQCIVGEGRSLNSLACCLILTPQKILMCHEDVQTSFFRTLGSANVVDVTAITEDPFVKTYCVLEFESQDVGISSNQWVLYFNAASEKKAFIQAFSGQWSKEFQVEVPIHYIQDVPLQTKCREIANYLRDFLKLK